jgi:hypothetical protein
VSTSGAVYVTGRFGDTVDFDPDPGIAERTSDGLDDAFLAKFDSSGDFQWVCSWGGTEWDESSGVAVDDSGDAYVIGVFRGTVDFDPGPDINEQASNGDADIFLNKFDAVGNFEWVCAWGGIQMDCAYGVVVDNANDVYIAGKFHSEVDFDPGPDVEEHTSAGAWDAFLIKLNPTGDFQWVRTWGGADIDEGLEVGISPSGMIYVIGVFYGAADFDPGLEINGYLSNGASDVFLSKFDEDGGFLWERVWGGTGSDYGYGVAVDDSGNVCVTGVFEDAVDFDPGPASLEYVSNGNSDAFLSKLDYGGNLQWARTWGGKDYDRGNRLAVDDIGSIYVLGYFEGSADFNPTPLTDYHISNGLMDAYLVRFPPDGNW